jgi:mono/diheme cytochrome c family protein
MFKKVSLLLISVGLLSACSNDYTPEKTATAEQIYKGACASCHSGESADSSKYWTINKKNANKAYVTYKVKSGSLTMPKFNNINAEDLEKISEFVLKHSIIK